MGNELIALLIIPIVFFIAVNMILQEEIEDTTAPLFETITCPFPAYNDTYSQCGVEHNTVYANDQFIIWNASGAWYSGGNDWVAGIPTGWANYLTDTFWVFFTKAFAVISLIIIPLALPAVISGLDFMWAINIPLYIMLGIGIYKGVSPFV